MSLVRFLFRLLLGRRMPRLSGRLTVEGLKDPVRIRRDAQGVVYIEAQGDEDAYFGLGFAHGQDRAFQLEFYRRLVRGELAGLVGAELLAIDRLMRRIGFRRAAERQLEVLSERTLSDLEAYAAGVRAGVVRGARKLAHEFALLRARPGAYDAADVLAFLKLQGFLLASNWDVELARLRILMADGPDAVRALDPAYPEWLPVSAPPGAPAGRALDRLGEDLARLSRLVGVGGGSNNWALAPARTATGRALLANDPHLAPLLPSPWYIAQIRTPAWALAGASFVGTPGFPAGHNGTVAWGVTAGMADNTDLFVEEMGADGVSVREGEGFVACEVRSERIPVRGRAAEEERVLVTRRGPIILPAGGEGRYALSLSATWLAAKPLEGLLGLARVRDFNGFRDVLSAWPALSLNLVYADAGGHIGWQLAGEVPRRRKGSGLVPAPGWEPDQGWEAAPVPFAEMPCLRDPDAGFVATANNRPLPEGEAPYLGADWLDGYREARIVEALSQRTDWDVGSTQALQLDRLSLPWREVGDIVLAAPPMSEEAGLALRLLRAWDGRLDAGSAPAAVFSLFLAEMARRVAETKAPKTWRLALGAGPEAFIPLTFFAVRRTGHLVRLLREQPAGWLPRAWGEEIAQALARAAATLRRRCGHDPRRWRWGEVRCLTLRHPAGEKKPLDRVFNRGPIACGGDANTVAQATSPPFDPTGDALIIASLRLVIDVGAWDNTRVSLPGGQSGNPLSPHYDDFLPLWHQGEGITLAFTEKAIARRVVAELVLAPQAP